MKWLSEGTQLGSRIAIQSQHQQQQARIVVNNMYYQRLFVFVCCTQQQARACNFSCLFFTRELIFCCVFLV